MRNCSGALQIRMKLVQWTCCERKRARRLLQSPFCEKNELADRCKVLDRRKTSSPIDAGFVFAKKRARRSMQSPFSPRNELADRCRVRFRQETSSPIAAMPISGAKDALHRSASRCSRHRKFCGSRRADAFTVAKPSFVLSAVSRPPWLPAVRCRIDERASITRRGNPRAMNDVQSRATEIRGRRTTPGLQSGLATGSRALPSNLETSASRFSGFLSR